MLWNSNEDTRENVFIDDACLTPLCTCVQLTFVQHMDRIKPVCFILKVLFQLPIFVAQLIHRPDLLSFSLVEQKIYDQSCTLIKHVYTCHKPARAPN